MTDALSWMEAYEREQREARDLLWNAHARCKTGTNSGRKPIEALYVEELRKLFADGQWRTSTEVGKALGRRAATARKALLRLGAKTRLNGRSTSGMEYLIDV